EATLHAYERESSHDAIPVLQMLSVDANELRKRAKSLARRLAKLPRSSIEVLETKSYSGGGSLPEEALPDWAVAIRWESQSADDVHRALRTGEPPIVARIADDAVLLHMRALMPD